MAKKWGKCDFDDLKRLQKRLERLQQIDFDKFCQAAAKELAARLLAKAIKRTPVGKKPRLQGPKTAKATGESGKTKSFLTSEGAMLEKYWSGYVGGALRRGWTARTEQEAQSGGSVNAQEYAQSLPITKQGNVYQIEIINPVHYASYVEYGHRQQPGRFVPALGKSLKAGWVKGRFMLTISEQELRSEAPALLEQKLTRFLGECLNGK